MAIWTSVPLDFRGAREDSGTPTSPMRARLADWRSFADPHLIVMNFLDPLPSFHTANLVFESYALESVHLRTSNSPDLELARGRRDVFRGLVRLYSRVATGC